MTSKIEPLHTPLLESELPRLYRELAAIGARAEGLNAKWRFGTLSPETLLILAAQTARQEPRLLWVVVELVSDRYDRFDLLELRRQNSRARWPAALAVAFEFAKKVRPSQDLTDVADFLFKRLRRAPGEQFFLTTRAFGGSLARRDAEESLAEYKRWGYLSREEPIAKELDSAARGTLGPNERQNLLRRLAERQPEFSLADYLEALRGRGSKRQASRDLSLATFLRKRGTTRGARYSLRT
jgi:hypothetical protein